MTYTLEQLEELSGETAPGPARTALPELIARVRELEQMTTPRPIDEAPKDRYILVWHKSYSCWKGATWNEYFDAFCSSLGAVQTIGLGWVEAGGYPSVYANSGR